MHDDDYDELTTRIDLEARFRELEAEAEIERMGGRRAERRPGARDAGAQRGASQRASRADDPLADLKAQFERSSARAAGVGAKEPIDPWVIVLCPSCQAKNRTPLARLRRADPICGACGRTLAVRGE